MITSNERRTLRHVEQNPDAVDQAARRAYGFSTRDSVNLLRVVADLQRSSNGLTAAHVKTIKAAHPHLDAKAIDNMAHAIRQHPARQQAVMLAGALGADPQGGMQGDLVNANGNTLAILKAAREMDTVDISDSIIAKRGGQDDDGPRYKPDEPGSVRALVSEALAPGQAGIERRFEAGDEVLHHAVRNTLADRLEAASATLANEDASAREVISAAWDETVGADLASDQFGIGP